MSIETEFPNPARIVIPKEFQRGKRSTNLPSKIADIVAGEASDTATIGSVGKIIRGGVKLGITTDQVSKEVGNSVVSHLNSVIDTFKVLGIFKNIKTVLDNSKAKVGEGEKEKKTDKAERLLKIGQASAGITVAGMAGVKLLEGFNLLKIANISQRMGITSLSSSVLRTCLSFSVIFSAAEIVETGFTIAGASLRMHNLNKKMKRAKDKVTLWKKRPMDVIAKQKINHDIPKKMKAASDQIRALAPNVEKTANICIEVKSAYDKINSKTPKTKFGKLTHKWSLKKAENKGKVAAHHHLEACKKFDAANKTHDKAKANLKSWKNILKSTSGELTYEDDATALTALRESKMAKWKTKVKNITWDKVKEGVTLGMSSYLTLYLISVIVLAVVFPIALPFEALLALGIGGLLLSLGFGAKHILGKCMTAKKCGKTPYESVAIPALAS